MVADEEFWDIADSFIDLANEHCEASDADKVSAAELYAAARFRLFVEVGGKTDVPISTEQREEMIESILEEFRQMLEINLEEYPA